MLHPIRTKEVHLREHFEDKMFGAAFMRERRAAAVKVDDAPFLPHAPWPCLAARRRADV